jgi:iron(III) transport system substrate-binding protein
MQVQSATEPPKKVAVGERSVMVDGTEYVLLAMQDAGSPVMPIYAVEGSPIFSGMCAVMERAAHPNAARVFQSFLFSQPCQQVMSDVGFLRSFHPGVTEKAGRVKLHEIKLLRSGADQLAAAAEEIKRRYAAVFGV